MLANWARIDADLDEVALYHRRLTAGEIAALSASRDDPSQGLGGDGWRYGARCSPRRADRHYRAVATVGAPPLHVTFAADLSFDPVTPNAPSLTYAWDFCDGTTANGLSVDHVYDALGSYTATLTVTNAVGKRSQASYLMRVFNRPPTANIQATGVDGSLTLSGAESFDPDQTALTYAWRLPSGEKTGEQITVGGLPAGSHEIALTVTDTGGATNTAYYTVTVPDSQGYRMAENPDNLILGLHYQYFKLFNKEGKLFRTTWPRFSWHRREVDRSPDQSRNHR